MTVTRVSSATAVGSTSVAPTFGATPTAGNLLLATVAVFSGSTTATCTTPSGWTLLTSKTAGSSFSHEGVFLFGKIAAGGDTAPSFTTNGATITNPSQAILQEWSGLISTSIAAVQDIVFTPGSLSGGSGSLATSAGTTTSAPDWIYAVVGGAVSVSGALSSSWASGITLDTTAGSTAGGGGFAQSGTISESSTVTITPTYTITANGSIAAILAVAFKQPAVALPATPNVVPSQAVMRAAVR